MKFKPVLRIKPQFIIAAPTSNGGKTTLTLGLLRVLRNRGLSPCSFKCGPDYIDPKFHKVASGNEGINLDLIMMSEAHIQQRYKAKSNNSQSVCIEGVMGLFDGAVRAKGSTAELAKLLQLPVLLIVDAKSVAYSVAALIQGFRSFDTQVEVAGVIFNRVRTASHYQFLKEACEDIQIPSFGYLPPLPECEIPSRHLGLSLDELQAYDSTIERIANQLEKTVAIDQLLATFQRPFTPPTSVGQHALPTKPWRIAVAKDDAFCFIYPHTIEVFKQLGQVVFFSPLSDQDLPVADFYYFPGGYPELYAEELQKNSSMRQQVYATLQSAACLAECGGLMYLGKELIDQQGDSYAMAGVFSYSTSMKKTKLSLGYRHIKYPD